MVLLEACLVLEGEVGVETADAESSLVSSSEPFLQVNLSPVGAVRGVIPEVFPVLVGPIKHLTDPAVATKVGPIGGNKKLLGIPAIDWPVSLVIWSGGASPTLTTNFCPAGEL